MNLKPIMPSNASPIRSAPLGVKLQVWDRYGNPFEEPYELRDDGSLAYEANNEICLYVIDPEDVQGCRWVLWDSPEEAASTEYPYTLWPEDEVLPPVWDEYLTDSGGFYYEQDKVRGDDLSIYLAINKELNEEDTKAVRACIDFLNDLLALPEKGN